MSKTRRLVKRPSFDSFVVRRKIFLKKLFNQPIAKHNQKYLKNEHFDGKASIKPLLHTKKKLLKPLRRSRKKKLFN